MFSITNYQRNANQNYNEVSPNTEQNGHHRKNLQTINKMKKQPSEQEKTFANKATDEGFISKICSIKKNKTKQNLISRRPKETVL